MSRATRGGYLFASDGTKINEADIIKNSTDFTGARISMGEIHAFIHRGIVFDLSLKFVVPSNTTIYLTGQTNGKNIHFHKENYKANAGGIEFKLFEDATGTGGDLLEPLNRNRLSNNESTFILKSGATVTNTGKNLYLIGFPVSNTPVSGGTLSGSETEEWVLKQDTLYAIEIKNLSNAERTIYADLCWYEP